MWIDVKLPSHFPVVGHKVLRNILPPFSRQNNCIVVVADWSVACAGARTTTWSFATAEPAVLGRSESSAARRNRKMCSLRPDRRCSSAFAPTTARHTADSKRPSTSVSIQSNSTRCDLRFTVELSNLTSEFISTNNKLYENISKRLYTAFVVIIIIINIFNVA